MAISTELLWALIGLLLTIGGTFLPASVAVPSRDWGHQAIQMYALGITYQFGAGLLVGCVAGKNPATLSQVAYVLLGLTPWFPVFSKGGGLGYLAEPSFGYILGFIPGAWICGYLAFKAVPKLEVLLISCLTGLLSIHFTGLLYLGGLRLLGVVKPIEFIQLLLKFSVEALPGQFAVVCAVTILAYGLRRLLFY
ncbi:biotin transporter BioY [Leptolyngbya sp. Cla-17]|uniref:biotin transporter BioY n=1 Tax=Leptolyngbya sp. Cla-17 TaxID=2803751 RepID=UPI001F5DD5B1|nr:biotin transporter BioY [Leptolyngbya sp. Cla-17]